MAEIGESGDVHKGKGKKRGGIRAKKMSTRIDMTPMVDLGFLLVTFFILTTTMSKPKAMQVVMPDKDVKEEEQNKIRCSEAFTILLGANDRIFYYNPPCNETDELKMEVTSFAKFRKILIDKNNEVLALQRQNGWKRPSDTTYNGVYIGIKPTDDSKYENMVNMLDEMKICGIKAYAILDPTPEEIAVLPK